MDELIKIGKTEFTVTNLDKVYWPDEGYTKGDMIKYYYEIANYMLPYLKNRPESMNRFPNGIKGPSFYQKNVGDKLPKWLKTEKLYSESNDEYIHYLICNDKATLVYMANLGCIEINPWCSTIKFLDKPDYLVIDLDPEDISFDKVIETARAVKEVLDKAKCEGYCKTSGATGLHIYVPLNHKYDYEIAREFAKVIASHVHDMIPGFTSMERSPKNRQKKVYLDYLQNSRGQTLAAPYSLRPKPGATVSAPLEWKELKTKFTPQDFTIKTIQKRLKKKGDLFKGVLGKGVNIEKCLKNLNT